MLETEPDPGPPARQRKCERLWTLPSSLLALLVVSPVFTSIVGWIGGFAGAAAYNYLVKWTGGLSFEIKDPGVVAPFLLTKGQESDDAAP